MAGGERVVGWLMWAVVWLELAAVHANDRTQALVDALLEPPASHAALVGADPENGNATTCLKKLAEKCPL
eukprot:COSAG02_NODE_30684_length_547_cov_0.685268_1_plen_69_part_10